MFDICHHLSIFRSTVKQAGRRELTDVTVLQFYSPFVRYLDCTSKWAISHSLGPLVMKTATLFLLSLIFALLVASNANVVEDSKVAKSE